MSSQIRIGRGDIMSHTIYGGRTKNDIDIDAMVDDNRDLVFDLDDEKMYFARLSGSRTSVDEEQIPAIAAFSYQEPFVPIYAEIINGQFIDYFDGFGFSKLFETKLDDFKLHFNDFVTRSLNS